MSREIYELQGFVMVLDKVVLLSRVFEADNNEGYQFQHGMMPIWNVSYL